MVYSNTVYPTVFTTNVLLGYNYANEVVMISTYVCLVSLGSVLLLLGRVFHCFWPSCRRLWQSVLPLTGIVQDTRRWSWFVDVPAGDFTKHVIPGVRPGAVTTREWCELHGATLRTSRVSRAAPPGGPVTLDARRHLANESDELSGATWRISDVGCAVPPCGHERRSKRHHLVDEVSGAV